MTHPVLTVARHASVEGGLTCFWNGLPARQIVKSGRSYHLKTPQIRQFPCRNIEKSVLLPGDEKLFAKKQQGGPGRRGCDAGLPAQGPWVPRAVQPCTAGTLDKFVVSDAPLHWHFVFSPFRRHGCVRSGQIRGMEVWKILSPPNSPRKKLETCF